MKKVPLEHILNIEEIIADNTLCCTTVDQNQRLLILTTEIPNKYIQQVNDNMPFPFRSNVYNAFALMKAAGISPRYHINCYSNGDLSTIDIYCDQLCSKLQTINDNQFLLVSGRSRNDSVKNAFIYDANGQLLNSFAASDAIADVQVSGDNIWVSYFDEGILYYDESDPDKLQVSSCGLACFTPSGKVKFCYSDLINKHNLPDMVDCYAINAVADDELWLYYYSAFPLIRIKNFELVQYWLDFPIKYAQSVAIGYRAILFARSSGHSPVFINQFYYSTNRIEEISLLDQQGNIIEDFSSFARGAYLYVKANNNIYRVNVNDISS